jgi:DNA-binding NarL/FixJ family response regulator
VSPALWEEWPPAPADGFSNKEIAAQLYVRVSAVEKHLSHAYGKLGVRSRGQLAGRLAAPV